jgi:hypothetical protein
MRVWWSKSPAPGNFGDILTPLIFQHYGIDCEWATRNNAEAISTGSIIRFARPDMQVLGSGAISHNDEIEPRASYKWVRGPLTAELVRKSGAYCPEIYGDPAMLLPRIFKQNIKPDIEVGIFAHYVDLDLVDGFVINPLNPVEKVLADVCRCKRIASSSLHGIIAAHAYGIPAAWVKINKLTGDDIKFHDHALSVGLQEMPLSTIDNPVFTLPSYDDTAIHEILNGH